MTTEAEHRKALCSVAGRVRERLDELGEYKPGCCLYASVVGCAELRKLGYNAMMQAGSCTWRRLPPEAPESANHDGLGYVWNPEDPHSVAMMKRGWMPEFHSWVGVVHEHSPDGFSRAGWFVDFSAHLIPDMFAQLAGVGLPWLARRPPNPFVANAEDCEAEHRRAKRDNRPLAWWYDVNPEATLTCLFVARSLVVRHMRDGHDVEDLFPVFGPGDGHKDGIEINASTALKLVRRYRKDHPEAWATPHEAVA
jgi:hypothetical protein